ncbi:hypothetical protein [Mitsuaria sp. BK037]|uniref:hypothetical protein n=1 Tax=Mitsuaria sp. BK037 TaxID=2587122 RepID=UPI001615B4B3|nr:hypothetical protein [Mitsuaria sp. BK037]MBB3284733.1 hypothetical protein [Mitsuaria sp. BK037]
MAVANRYTPDLQALAARFTALAQREPEAAMNLWRTEVEPLPSLLSATVGRLADPSLSPSARATLTARPDGNALLLRWFLDRQDRPAFPRTQFFSSAVAYAFCEALIQQRGKPAASAALREGRVVLLGLRQDTSTLANKGRGVYDDYIVVLNAWGQRGHAHLFPATTEPTAQYAQRASVTASGARVDARYKDVRFKEAHGADVDKDGIRDAGRLAAGTYFFTELPRIFLKDRAFWASADQTVERDTDGDGRFTLADRDRIDRHGVGRTMYIHQGGPTTNPAVNTWSAGCQTVPQNYYPRFLASLGARPKFFYVLVDCR